MAYTVMWLSMMVLALLIFYTLRSEYCEERFTYSTTLTALIFIPSAYYYLTTHGFWPGVVFGETLTFIIYYLVEYIRTCM